MAVRKVSYLGPVLHEPHIILALPKICRKQVWSASSLKPLEVLIPSDLLESELAPDAHSSSSSNPRGSMGRGPRLHILWRRKWDVELVCKLVTDALGQVVCITSSYIRTWFVFFSSFGPSSAGPSLAPNSIKTGAALPENRPSKQPSISTVYLNSLLLQRNKRNSL